MPFFGACAYSLASPYLSINQRFRGFNDLHWHEELHITLVTKGKLTIQINGINYHLQAGQAIFINKSVLHIVTLTNSYLLSFEIRGDTEWQNHILQILWSMKQEFDRPKTWGWQYEISIKTVQLWLILVSNMSMPSEESSKHNRLKQERLQLMLSFIHQHYSNPITLNEIADAAHLR
jgi:Uncharacterized conserved protein, contains double-stranded beta-helix domain